MVAATGKREVVMSRTIEKVYTDEDTTWTDADVARYLKVGVRTVWRYAEKLEGFPKPRKLRGLSRWIKSEVVAFMTAKP